VADTEAAEMRTLGLLYRKTQLDVLKRHLNTWET